MTDALNDHEDGGPDARIRRLRALAEDVRAGRAGPTELAEAGVPTPADGPFATTADLPADASGTAEDAGEAAETEGRAADGLVVATAAGGRLARIEVDGTVMRRPLEEIGTLCATAATAALRGQRGGSGAGPDLSALDDMLRGVQQEGMRAMARIEAALGAVIADVGPRTGMAGDPRATGLDGLLGATVRNLADARAAVRDRPVPADRQGTDQDGTVVAAVTTSGTVSLRLDPGLARATSYQLGISIVEAVNAALGAPVAEGTAPGPDPTDLSRRVAELQDASLAQMTSYTSALRSIMNRIGEP